MAKLKPIERLAEDVRVNDLVLLHYSLGLPRPVYSHDHLDLDHPNLFNPDFLILSDGRVPIRFHISSKTFHYTETDVYRNEQPVGYEVLRRYKRPKNEDSPFSQLQPPHHPSH
jgi:hypothetical protein